MTDDLAYGLVDWPAVLADVPGFLGRLLDAHHDAVVFTDGLDHYCHACGFGVEPGDGHAPRDTTGVPLWLETARSAPRRT